MTNVKNVTKTSDNVVLTFDKEHSKDILDKSE